MMKVLLKLEEVAMLAVSLYGLWFYEAAWWWYLLLLLGPDISMIGYAGGNRTGAIAYNIFHHKGLAVALFLAGIIFHQPVMVLTGMVLFGHASMDRMFGYGLKLEEGFKFTHLGIIGREKQ